MMIPRTTCMKLSILICAYNERKTILDAIHQAHAVDLGSGWDKEIIVVDNCSTDGTRELLQDVDLPGVRVIYHPHNLGKSGSLKTGIDLRDQHLRSKGWLDASAHPYIEFKGENARKIRKGHYRLTGTFTIKGVSRTKSIDVKVKQIPSSLAKRVGLGDKPWLRVRASFSIKLSDFGVRIPSMTAAKVNDRWTVKLSLFAGAKQ